MSLQDFKASKTGTRIAPILTSPDSIRRMLAKSQEARPAVEAIGSELAEHVGNLSYDDRKMVGRWVRELLEPRGWVPDRKGRVAPGNLFARGTIYRRAGHGSSPTNGESAAARLAAARAILATMPHPVMSADELIAERRRAFKVGE